MKITNTEVNGMQSAIRASGYPMMRDDLSYDRMARLGKCSPGAGHDCALKGIVVQADVQASQAWWLQFQRYHFADIVSSESKMHKIMEMDIGEQCNQYVEPEAIRTLERLIEEYKNEGYDMARKELFQRVVANTPMGLMLKARITTNYLQLKTIYLQRKNHKLEEWTTFCDWILSLPHFIHFTEVE